MNNVDDAKVPAELICNSVWLPAAYKSVDKCVCAVVAEIILLFTSNPITLFIFSNVDVLYIELIFK